MIIDDKHITGWVEECYPHLNRSIAQFQRYYKYVKIGITGNTEQRAKQHDANEKKYCWERMVVKYSTTSEKHANWIEGKYQEREDFVNVWTGWSHMTEEGPYYVYILLGNHKHRLGKK